MVMFWKVGQKDFIDMEEIDDLPCGEDTPYIRLVIAAGQAFSSGSMTMNQLASAIEPHLNEIMDARMQMANSEEPTPSAAMIKAGVKELEFRMGSRYSETSHITVKAIYKAMIEANG